MITSHGQLQIPTLAICIEYYRAIYYSIQEEESTSKVIFLIWMYNNFVSSNLESFPVFSRKTIMPDISFQSGFSQKLNSADKVTFRLYFFFFPLLFCTQNNSQILLFKALEVTIAIHESAHTQGTWEIKSYLKKTKKPQQIHFYDTDHGIHCVLKRGNKGETLICWVAMFKFNNTSL